MRRVIPLEASVRLPPDYVAVAGARPWDDTIRAGYLVKHLTKRHLAARYRGSSLGFVWSLLNPLLMLAVYGFVFRFILRMSVPGVPYAVFFLTGYLAWQFFHVAVMNAATSLIDGGALIRGSSFPRILLPLAAVLSNATNYLLSIPVLLAFNAVFGVLPGWSLLLLPAAFLLLVVLAAGIGVAVASLAPWYRDLLQVLEVLLMAWFFATPVLYPASMALDRLGPVGGAVYALNPMVGIVSLVRASFFPTELSPLSLLASGLACLIAWGVGWRVYRRLSPDLPQNC